jgi:hypothetical protein
VDDDGSLLLTIGQLASRTLADVAGLRGCAARVIDHRPLGLVAREVDCRDAVTAPDQLARESFPAGWGLRRAVHEHELRHLLRIPVAWRRIAP